MTYQNKRTVNSLRTGQLYGCRDIGLLDVLCCLVVGMLGRLKFVCFLKWINLLTVTHPSTVFYFLSIWTFSHLKLLTLLEIADSPVVCM